MEFLECKSCSISVPFYPYVTYLYFIFGISEIVSMFGLVVYLRAKNNLMKYGHSPAILMPIYNIVVIFTMFFSIAIGLESLINVNRNLTTMKVVRYFAFHRCTEGVAILLLHRSLGRRAIRNAFIIGLVWGLASAIIPALFFVYVNYNAYWISMLFNYGILLLFYSICFLTPVSILHRRQALVNYSKYFMVIYLYMTTLFGLAYQSCEELTCYIEGAVCFIELISPYIILSALLEDSLFWQGLYSNVSTSNLNQPLLGMWELSRDTLSIFTDSIAHMETKMVPLIPFSSLKLNMNKFFPGGSARVYQGLLGNADVVAIKLLFCIELTQERVIDFCKEASILYSLQHPNILRCYGVSIMPPAIALVTEFCHLGSLFDFLYNTDVIMTEKGIADSLIQVSKSHTSSSRKSGSFWSNFMSLLSSNLSSSSASCNVLQSDSGLSANSGYRVSHYKSIPSSEHDIESMIKSNNKLHDITEEEENEENSSLIYPYDSNETKKTQSNRSRDTNEGAASQNTIQPNSLSLLFSYFAQNIYPSTPIAPTSPTQVATTGRANSLIVRRQFNRRNTVGSLYSVDEGFSKLTMNRSQTEEYLNVDVRVTDGSLGENTPSSETSTNRQLSFEFTDKVTRDSVVFKFQSIYGPDDTVDSDTTFFGGTKIDFSHQFKDNGENRDTLSPPTIEVSEAQTDSNLSQIPQSTLPPASATDVTPANIPGVHALVDRYELTIRGRESQREEHLGGIREKRSSSLTRKKTRRRASTVQSLTYYESSNQRDMVDNGQSFNKSLSHRSRISLPDHLSSKTLNFSKLQTSGIIANLNDDADSQSTLVSAMELMESSEMLFGLGPTQCVEELRLRTKTAPPTLRRELSSKSSNIDSFLIHSSVHSQGHSASNPHISLNSNSVRQSLTMAVGQTLPISLRLRMIRDCIAGVSFLHSHGFVHCDIKSLNFLVTHDFVVKLADLGESRQATDLAIQSVPRNINWSSPEVLLESSSKLGASLDVWSLALVISEILTGQVPFDSKEYREMNLNTFIEALEIGARPTIPLDIIPSPDFDWLRDVLSRAWLFNSNQRIKSIEMLQIVEQNLPSYGQQS